MGLSWYGSHKALSMAVLMRMEAGGGRLGRNGAAVTSLRARVRETGPGEAYLGAPAKALSSEQSGVGMVAHGFAPV